MKIAEEQEAVNNLTTALPTLDPDTQATVQGQITAGKLSIAENVDLQGTGRQAFEIAQSNAQMYASFGQVGSTANDIARGTGSSTDSQLQAQAKRQEAQGSRDAARAQFEEQVAERRKAMEDALNDMIKQIIAFLKDLQDAKVDGMRAMTRV